MNEVSALETAKKKAEGRIETLEAKVRGMERCTDLAHVVVDGGHDPGQGRPEGE